jgi:peptidoglycan/LPS O-acetylase OafA/YrhL
MRRGRRQRWVVRGVMTAIGVAGLTVFALVEDTSPRVVPTVLLVAALVAIYGLLADTGGADAANWSPAVDSVSSAATCDCSRTTSVLAMSTRCCRAD